MQWLRTIDRELLELATQLGGTTLLRDQAVFALAEVLPFAFGLAALWLFLSGQTLPQRLRNRETAVLMVGGIILALGIRALIADAINRPRPFITYPDLHQAFLMNDIVSFPSGHAFMLFTGASVVLFSKHHRKLGIFLICLAIAVGVARIMAGVHYPSDVIGGAMLGLALGKLLDWQSDWVHRQLR